MKNDKTVEAELRCIHITKTPEDIYDSITHISSTEGRSIRNVAVLLLKVALATMQKEKLGSLSELMSIVQVTAEDGLIPSNPKPHRFKQTNGLK